MSWLGEQVGRGKSRCLVDLVDEPFPEIASWVLPVPVESWCERRVVAIGLRRLLLPKLRLGAHIRTKKDLVLVTVTLSLSRPRRRLAPSHCSRGYWSAPPR